MKPYLRDIIIDLQEFDTCKNQLKIAISFIFWKDDEEEHVMHSKSDNVNLTFCNDANEFVGELF